jgi:hypothetical protein
LRTASDAYARVNTPPPGAQLLEAIRARKHPERTVVFGGPSVRFFEGTELASRAFSAGTMGDVNLALGRLNDMPAHVLVTGEVETTREHPPPYPMVEVGNYCRPARIDRRAPCLVVRELKAPFLARERPNE